jgi:hypothetical protein
MFLRREELLCRNSKNDAVPQTGGGERQKRGGGSGEERHGQTDEDTKKDVEMTAECIQKKQQELAATTGS